ncbi:P-loop containing nucleoside triphosphate hydrolase protein [Kickxella alabastrina]|uniref:P-loop containing nucleoside triphosphate hydrolase protein n=1 Tax=Kickxella alabastrina TaxID=61397 RepID=UPI00221F72B0|nr:P-loop containing nucleoside triphosphate hydrolase protein [Kickxella alabastrina]KAI7828466.1 P-loop containing nucleoside triphosphate hydrolase protein [Kickxella alabastrina]
MTTRDTMYSEDIVLSCNRSQLISVLDEGVTRLPPETDNSGNIEYKTKLNNTSITRTSHLATQLQWRLAEGCGQAVYVVGVHDDGEVIGITEKEFQLTLDILNDMAGQLGNAHVSSINRRVLADKENRVVAEVCITQRNAVQRSELRVTVLGDHSAGKSTVLGCLTYGEADNGRGKARLNLLRHRHEVESGRTSSIALGTIGFDSDGQVLSYANNNSAEQIYRRAQHVVTFIDTCGYSKHLKTTARAITGHSPHVFCVIIAADSETLTGTTRERLRIAAVLNMPLMVVISKMDLATRAGFGMLMHNLLAALDTTIPGRSKCVVTGSAANEHDGLAVVPIFTTSAVRIVGFGEITTVLSKSRPVHASGRDGLSNSPSLFEYHIEHLYSFDAVGTVVTGWVHAGVAKPATELGRKLVVGPDSTGKFTDVEVTSIHTLRVPTETAKAGSSAALAIQTQQPVSIQKGMVIVDAERLRDGSKRCVSDEFVARIAVLDPEFSTMNSVIVHIRSAYRLARIVEITSDPPVDADTSEKSAAFSCYSVLVRLKFDDSVCDYLYPGMPIIARDGQSLTFAGHIEAVL